MLYPEVVIYTQPGCPPCGTAKEFLTKHEVPFEEKNIRENPEHIQTLQQLGSKSTPTTVIGDEVIIGFDRDRFEELLNL